MPTFNSDILTLELEDNRLKDLADKKAKKDILVCILIFAALFCFLYFTGDYEPKAVKQIKRGEDKESYPIELKLQYDGEELNVSEEITVLPENYEDEETEYESEDFLTAFARKLLKEVESDNTGDSLVLPTEKDGVSINWIMPSDEIPYSILIIGILLCLVIYFSRYDKLKREDLRKRAEFAEELPNMIMQYILMLNAGLISEYAFEELILQNSESKNYLYKVFNALLKKVRSSNSSFVSEMYAFACTFGNKEFIRFATLCIEHSSRGSELASKLNAERENAWNSKISRAKAKAKEAETKLCFPLMLLLVSLVIICITPAVVEM